MNSACFTNKGGQHEPFDDQWFESFTDPDVCGEPLFANRLPCTPISEGLADHFILEQEREMEYPFVKRARGTMNVPKGFPETYTERMNKIMGPTGSKNDQHLISQMQIYAGGAVAENGKAEITSYSWRELAFGMSYDSFYEGEFGGEGYDKAQQWQSDNDEVFVGQQKFADTDMRFFAFTFGDQPLGDDNVWPCYYDSEEKYNRLRRIKGKVDPDGIFSPDKFSLKPL